MKIDSASQLETIAASLPGAIAVFDSVGVDYSCGARLSLREAATVAGVEPGTLIAALQALDTGAREIDWSARSLKEIAHEVTTGHHEMLRDQLPRIAMGFSSLCTAITVPDVRNLRAELAELSAELIPHLHDEERNVFRIVEALESAWQTNEKPPSLDHGLHKMISELTVAHGSIAQRIHRIRDLRVRIGTHLDMAPECEAVLTLLEQFEGHLRQQIFIENCIFFPRALALEEQMIAASNAPA